MMKKVKKIGKGGLLKAARNSLTQRKELLGQADNLQSGYQKLLGEHQPKIDKIQEQADNLAKEFKRLYAESQEAYSSGEGALAKSLSIEGHAIQERCEAINARANILRSELKAILNRIESLRRKANELQLQANEYYKKAAAMRGTTYVRGFEFSGIMSNDDVEEFFDEFPQMIFEKVQRVKFKDILVEDRFGTSFGKTRWNEKAKKFEVEIFRHISENDLKETISHEIGHVIFSGFMRDTQRWQWGEWYQDSMKTKNFITRDDPETRGEDFSECFVKFKTNPQKLKDYDQKRFDFINEIYHNLEQG